MNSNCIGCNVKDVCLIKSYSNNCPCKKCLVKVTCDVVCKSLSGFNKFIRDTHSSRAFILTTEEMQQEIDKYIQSLKAKDQFK